MSADPKSGSALHAATPASAPPPRRPLLCTSSGYPDANLRLEATTRNKCCWLNRDRGFTAERSSSKGPVLLHIRTCIAMLVLLSDEGAAVFPAAVYQQADVKMMLREGDVLRKVEAQLSF